MKTARRIFVIYIFSLVIASGILFINRNVIVSGWDDKIYEIAFISLPVFVVLLLLYAVIKAVLKTVKVLKQKNKRPSKPEDLNKL